MKCVMRVTDWLDAGAGKSGVITGMKKQCLLVSLLAAAVLWSGPTQAEAPQLTLQMRSGQTAGRLADGQLLAQGVVVYSGAHNGFRVWSEAIMNGAPQRYTLTGTANSKNRMDIRLTGRNWLADTKSGKGIVLRSAEYSATFAVEVDGAQTLPVDTWALQLRAVVLLP